MNLQGLYGSSPVFLQNLMVTGYGLKIYRREYGKRFRRLLAEIEARQWCSEAELIEYQNDKLKSLIKHCYENVPYYRSLMDARKLRPADIRTIYDLPKLPVLKRETVQNELNRLRATNFRYSELVAGFTSGTTGSPLQLFWDKRICRVKTATDWLQKKIAGINPGDRIAFFLGRQIVPLHQKKPPFWRHNWIFNHLFCSSWHLSQTNLKAYFDKLGKFKPLAIEGYPSTMYILARYLAAAGRTFPLKAVFTSSEPLFDDQREVIRKAFACSVFDFYGMAERVVFGFECEMHEGKHLSLDFGITEILSHEGEPAGNGRLGRLVATGLHNYAMPLIRYQSSDVTAVRAGDCRCGRKLPLIENITTKDEDIITTSDGRYLPSSALNALTKSIAGIAEHQIIQEDRSRIIVRMTRGQDYSDMTEGLIMESLRKILGPDMSIELQFVDEIPRTKAGKFKWVISRVPLEF